jgi:hypothetical protein
LRRGKSRPRTSRSEFSSQALASRSPSNRTKNKPTSPAQEHRGTLRHDFGDQQPNKPKNRASHSRERRQRERTQQSNSFSNAVSIRKQRAPGGHSGSGAAFRAPWAETSTVRRTPCASAAASNASEETIGPLPPWGKRAGDDPASKRKRWTYAACSKRQLARAFKSRRLRARSCSEIEQESTFDH